MNVWSKRFHALPCFRILVCFRSGKNDAAAVTFLLEAASQEPETVARQEVLAGALEMMARQPERWQTQVAAVASGERDCVLLSRRPGTTGSD